MKKSLIALVIIAIVCAFSFALAATFSDVPEEMWASKQIERWADEKIVVGYDDGTYKPSNLITRAEFATIVVKLFNPEKEADLAKYKDVKETDWYYTNLAKAVGMGAIEEASTTTMRPNTYVTRQEAVVILNSILKFAPARKDAVRDFEDYDEIADYAEEDVEVFSEREYVVGYPDGTFRPADTITRAEAATILDRIFKLIVSDKGTFDCDGIGVNGVVVVKSSDVTLKNADQVGRFIFLDEATKKSTKGVSDDGKKNAIVINATESKTTGRTSSGGSSSSSTSAKYATYTIKKSGTEYAVSRNGVKPVDGKRLKITVNGTPVVNEVINESTDLLEKLKQVAEAMNDNGNETQRIINTIDKNRYGYIDEIEKWGTATITKMALENKAELKEVGGGVHNFDIGDVYNALTDKSKAEVFPTAMEVLQEAGYSHAEILTALDNLPK